jgi:hypothetical protein
MELSLFNQSINFSKKLSLQMDLFVEDLLSSSMLFSGPSKGIITKDIIKNYLHNVKYLIHHTPKHLSMAVKQADQFERSLFKSFFLEKIAEEDGHENWADVDLNQKHGTDCDPNKVDINIKNLMTYVENSILNDERCYIGYIFLSEYVTVNLGGPWLSDLERYCGIKPDQLSVVKNHVELDKHHINDDLEILNKMFNDPNLQNETLKFVENCMDYFKKFSNSIVVNSKTSS